MATKVEKDEITGQDTTGHEWDGIKELNTPLPRWWLYVFYACIAWSVVWWVLYPAWPLVVTYTGGILGYDQRVDLVERVEEARAGQAQYVERIAAADVEQMRSDPDLLQFSIGGGQAAFADNCAPCHGLGGAGQGYFPTLADDDWLWGGALEDIQYTITHGIRNGSDEARFSEMPRYGADQILERDQIRDVVEYVLELGGGAEDAEAAARGAEIFAEQCAACHGESGEGEVSLGAPALNDAIWLYGGERDEITAQVSQPRHGVMPGFGDRLDEPTIRMLTVYVHSLGGGQ